MPVQLGSAYGEIRINAGDALNSIGAVQRGLGGLRGSLSSIQSDLTSAGMGMTMGITLPLVGVGVAAGKMAIDYQSGMNLLQATTKASDSQMAALGARAKALGADMGLPATSASDAAEAMLELGKAGLSIDDILSGARGVLQLSAAGQLSNADAAMVAANALNAFNLRGEDTTRVADLLAAAANSSSAEVRGIADALQMSSAVFASAGVPIEQLIAAIAEMANKGIQGSDAGTSLKQMLLALEAPTKKSKDLMDSLGIAIYDSRGQMLPFPAIISQFSSKLGGMSQQQRDAALATIFGSDAVRAANIVMMGGVDAFNEMYGAVTKEGAAADLAGARMKGLGGAIAGLGSQIETVALDYAEPFLGTLEGLVRSAADLVPQLMQIDPTLRNAALAFLAVMAAAGPVLWVLGGVAGALAFVLSPIGLLTVGVAALAAAWASDFMNIRESVGGLVAAFQEGGLAGLWAELQEQWAGPGLGDTIRMALARLPEIVGPYLAQIGGAIAAAWPGIQAQLATWGTQIWDWVNAAIPIGQAQLFLLWNTIHTQLALAWPGIQEQLMTWGARLWDWISPAIAIGQAQLFLLWNTISSEIALAWPGIQAQLAIWGTRFWDWITGASALATMKLNELAAVFNVWANSPEAQAAANQAGQTLGQGLVTGIGLALVGLGAVLQTTIQSKLAGGGADVMSGLKSLGDSFAMGIIEGILNAIGVKLPPLLEAGLRNAVAKAMAAANPMGMVAGIPGQIEQMIGAGKTLAGLGAGRAGMGEVQFAGNYQSGGVIPGPVGAPQLAMVHGGEEVIPAGAGGGGSLQPVIVQVEGRTLFEINLQYQGREGRGLERMGGRQKYD